MSIVPKNAGVIRLNQSQRIVACANATPSAQIPAPTATQIAKYPNATEQSEIHWRFVFKNVGNADGSIMATIIASHMRRKIVADAAQL